MIEASASPYSRASSSIGLPGTYGAMRRTYSGAWAATPALVFVPAASPGGNVGFAFHATAAG